MVLKRLEAFSKLYESVWFGLFSSLVVPFVAWLYTRDLLYPLGGDVGSFLKLSHAIFGCSDLVRGQNPWQYPPLIPLLAGFFMKFTDSATTMFLLGYLLLYIKTFSMYFLLWTVTRSQMLSAVLSIVDGMHPSYWEMYMWGGYANLLAFCILPICLLLYEKCENKRQIILLLALSTVLVLSHHLTALIYYATLFLYCFHSPKKALHALVFLLPFIIYRAIVGVSDWNITNPFAFQYPIEYKHVIFVFKDGSALVAWIAMAIFGFAYGIRKHKSMSILGLAWLLSPIACYVLMYYCSLMAIDYARLLYYLPQPLMVGTALLCDGLKHIFSEKSKWIRGRRRFLEPLIIFLLIAVLAFNAASGIFALQKGIVWYHHKIGNQTFIHNVLSYLTEMNPRFVVSRGPILPRMIEGYAKIPVLRDAAPRFLFKKKDWQELLTARAVLTTEHLIWTDAFILKEHAPRFFSRTPAIYIVDKGDYKLLGYFSDGYFQKPEVQNITFTADGYTIRYRNWQKTVRITKESLNIEYTNVSFQIRFWLPWKTTPSYRDGHLIIDWLKLRKSIRIRANVPANLTFIEKWKQYALCFDGSPNISICIESPIPNRNIKILHSSSLIEQVPIDFAVIYKRDKEALRWCTSIGKKVFENEMFAIIKLGSDAS